MLGVEGILAVPARSLDLQALLIFSAVIGFSGSLISLAISKWIAKMIDGRAVIATPRDATESWLVNTVLPAGRGGGYPARPEVAIYESPDANAFATGPTRNNALVAVSTGLLRSSSQERGRGRSRPRSYARRKRRHGDTCAPPGRREHVRRVLVASRRVRRRPRADSGRSAATGPGFSSRAWSLRYCSASWRR